MDIIDTFHFVVLLCQASFSTLTYVSSHKGFVSTHHVHRYMDVSCLIMPTNLFIYFFLPISEKWIILIPPSVTGKIWTGLS